MKYKVTKRFGKYREGQIVDDKELYIRRKIEEGGCLEVVKEKREKKMVKESYENKAMNDKIENKEK